MQREHKLKCTKRIPMQHVCHCYNNCVICFQHIIHMYYVKCGCSYCDGCYLGDNLQITIPGYCGVCADLSVYV